MYWCGKKQIEMTDKKARKKCINKNIRKRGKVCPYLVEERQIVRSVIRQRAMALYSGHSATREMP